MEPFSRGTHTKGHFAVVFSFMKRNVKWNSPQWKLPVGKRTQVTLLTPARKIIFHRLCFPIYSRKRKKPKRKVGREKTNQFNYLHIQIGQTSLYGPRIKTVRPQRENCTVAPTRPNPMGVQTMVQRDSSQTIPKKKQTIRESRSSFCQASLGSAFLVSQTSENYFFPRSKKALYANKGLVENWVNKPFGIACLNALTLI